MDTIPFNLLMLAVDLVLLTVLVLWLTNRKGGESVTQPLPDPDMPALVSRAMESSGLSLEEEEQPQPRRSNLWLWVLTLVSQIIAVRVLGKLLGAFLMNYIQGICWHFGGFLVISGIILYKKNYRITGVISAIPGVLLVLLGIDCIIYEPQALTVEHYKIVSSKVDRPIRIVFAADPQTDDIGSYEIRTFKTMNEQNADLVLFGGDYLQLYGRSLKNEDVLHNRFRGAVENTGFDPPLGAFAIKGNNESSEEKFQFLFEDTGVKAISETQTMDLGPIMLTILSVPESDLSKYHNGQRPKVFLKTEEEKAKFHVMVGHIPAFALGETDADLLLAGHTHGGQVNIPFYGPIATGIDKKLNFPRKWASGMTNLPNGSKLLVNRGTGMERGWAPLIRFNCTPEISVIEIVPE